MLSFETSKEQITTANELYSLTHKKLILNDISNYLFRNINTRQQAYRINDGSKVFFICDEEIGYKRKLTLKWWAGNYDLFRREWNPYIDTLYSYTIHASILMPIGLSAICFL